METKRFKLWHPAYGVVIASLSIMVATCTFLTYPSSLFINAIAEDFGISLGTAQLKMFTSGGTAVLMLPFVNKLYERFGFKPMVILGIFAYCGGFIGYALAPNVPLYLAAGIIQGIGNALCLFVAPTYMVNAWFDKGTSIALLCTTVPASLITSFTTPWVNSLIQTHGWRSAMITVSVIGIIIGGVCCLIWANPNPEAKGLRPFGYSGEKKAKEDNGALTVRGVSGSVAKKNYILYLFFFIAISNALFSNIMRYASPIATTSGFTESQAAQAISLYSAGMAICQLIGAGLVAKLGTRNFTLAFCAVNILSLIGLMYNGGSFVVFAVCLMLCAFSGATYMQSLALKEVYGIMDYPSILSIVMIGVNFCNMFGASLYGYAYDLTQSYNTILWVQIVMVALSMAFTYVIYKKKDTLPWTEKAVTKEK